MTCIIGIEQDGKVYIGGDSAGVRGTFSLCIRSDPKVFINKVFIMGFTSSFRMGQLLRYNLNVPEQTTKQDDYEYMVTTFIDAVRSCLSQGGYKSVENEVEEGGEFLVGYKGKLYIVDSDFQVGIPAIGYTAIGCGEEYAMGALHALFNTCPNKNPMEFIKLGLTASSTFSTGVCAPFVILEGVNE